MILSTVIQQIIQAQRNNLDSLDTGLKRDAIQKLPNLSAHALIVSGIRRSGKSTLLFQLLKRKYPGALYLNFEDSRLYGFERNDFSRLDEVIRENKRRFCFSTKSRLFPSGIDMSAKNWMKVLRSSLPVPTPHYLAGSSAQDLPEGTSVKNFFHSLIQSSVYSGNRH